MKSVAKVVLLLYPRVHQLLVKYRHSASFFVLKNYVKAKKIVVDVPQEDFQYVFKMPALPASVSSARLSAIPNLLSFLVDSQ